MNVFLNIINFFKKIFNKNEERYLPTVKENSEDSKKDIVNTWNAENEISDKNITLFLYKQLRIGNLESKYIPYEYRDKIMALLKEEKNIKKKQIADIKMKIQNYQ